MKRTVILVLVAGVALVPIAAAAAAAETDGGKHLLILGLRDGSRLRGTTRLESIPMDTLHGKLDLSIERIRTIAFVEKPAKGQTRPEARADFRGGDVLHGRIGQEVFALETPYGKTTVPVARIVRMDVWPVGLAAGLVGFWTGDGHAMDGLGKHHGTHPEAVTYTTDRYGNPRGAFAFNGQGSAFASNGQGGVVTVPDHAELDTDNAFTLSVWINPKAYRNKAGGEGWILSKHYDSTVHGNYGDYILRLLTNGTILFGVDNYTKPLRGDKPGISAGVASDAATPVPKNAWTHVAATFDRGAMYLYINGRLVAGKACTAVKCTTPTEYPHDDVCIGAVWQNGGSFTGAIDDVGIWNRALKPGEVARLAGYEPPPPQKGPVAFWKADGNANDSAGAHHGKANKGVCYTADRHDKANGAFLFNGRKGVVTVPDGDALDTDDAFTLSAWVRPLSYRAKDDKSGVYSSIIRKWYGESGGDYILALDSAGGLGLMVAGKDNGRFVMDSILAKSIASKNAWTHVAATFDRGTMRIYVNGRLEGTKASKIKRTQRSEYVGDDVTIGAYVNDHYYRFHGAIDDVGIWNRALTATEVAKLASPDSAGGADRAVCTTQGEER